jgi:hypothetical protein
LATLKLALLGLGGPITLTIGGLILLAKGVYDTNETFRNFVDNVGGVIASDFRNAVDGMAKDANSAASDIQTAYEDLTAKLDPIGQFIRKLFKDVFKDTSDSAEASATASSNSFNDFFNSLSTSAVEGFNGLNTIISNWWAGLPAPIRSIFGGNAASMLVGAAGYVAALPGRTPSGTPERQGPYLPPDLPNRNAPSGTPLEFPGSGGVTGGGGGGGKAKKEKELQEYIRNEQDFLRQVAQIGQNRIALTMGLSNEELNILQSQAQFRSDNAINEQQYLQDQRDAAKYSLETRDQYLKDIKEKYDNENTLIQQQFDQSVYAPFLALERQLIGENEALEASLKALREGRTELTAEERIGLEVNRQLQARAREGLAITPKVTKAIQDQAKAQDDLNKKILYTTKLKALEKEIKLLSIINSEERRLAELRADGLSNEEAQKIFNLEKIKKNIEDVRALIDGFVSQTSSDYKGFLKAVISGEDAADALRQFQEGLTDKVLTIFLDFAMAPVEKFMKEAFEGLFLPGGANGTSIGEGEREPGIEGNTTATDENTAAIQELTAAFNRGGSPSAAFEGGAGGGGAFDAANVFGGGGNLTGGIFDTIAQQMGGATESLDSFSAHMGQFVDSSIASSESLGTWTSEGLKNLDADTKEASGDWQKSLGTAVSAIGVAAGAVMGIAAGIGQIKKGGTSNILGGIGSIFMSLGGAIGGLGNLGLFGADGGVAPKGWKPFPVSAFANGGTVTGPTLGLVGEGKYNEAIVPLPNGRSIPVDLGNGIREKMGNSSPSSSSPPMLSMSFETTSINGVEYVSRDQLEQAMMETRKLASKEGAMRGANLAIDRLQQSPNIRRRVGMR